MSAEYVVPTLVIHPALRASITRLEADEPAPVDGADGAVPSMRLIRDLRQLQHMQTRSAALLVLIFVLAALEVGVGIAVILVISLQLAGQTDPNTGTVYECIAQPDLPEQPWLCNLGYAAAATGIVLAVAAAMVECLPCNVYDIREVAAIVLHGAGCILWAAVAALARIEHRQATDFFLKNDQPLVQTPKAAVRTLAWILIVVAAGIFGGMTILQVLLYLRRKRLLKEAEAGHQGYRRSSNVLRDTRQGQILVSYQGWHQEAFDRRTPVPVSNGWAQQQSRWRSHQLPAFSQG